MFLSVGKREQAAGQVRPGVPAEFEHERLDAPLQPHLAPDDSFDAIVNLAAHNAVMNPKSHAVMLRLARGGGNIKIAPAQRKPNSTFRKDGLACLCQSTRSSTG